jgi:hypothetical protein
VRRPVAFRQIDRSLHAIERQLRSALRTANQYAGKLVAKGKYEEAQAVVELARGALRFLDRFESVIAEWHESSGKSGDKKGPAKVPLWRYYVVFARTLMKLGGEGTLRDVIENIEAVANADPTLRANPGSCLSAADWKRAVERARGPMRQHGYIESVGQGRWGITKLGRDLAERSEG